MVVTDPTLGTTLGTLASLAVGASVTYTTSQTITQAELNAGAPVTNTAVVTDTQTPSQSSTVSTNVSGTPGVSIVKSVVSVGGVSGDPTATVLGEAIDYSVVVTNTGNETLTNVVVTDPTLGTTLGTLASLAVGASVTYTASQTITQAELNSGGPVTNTAVVTDTQTPSQSSTVSTNVSGTPGVSIVKSVVSVGGVSGDPTATKLGEAIDYSVVVTNTGNETLTNVVVTDPTLGTTLGTLASLAVGASVTYTASQTITQAELNAGAPLTNTAVVTDTQTPSQSSTVSTNVSGTPGVSIVKSVVSVGGVSGDPTATKLGEAIDYSVVVTNTGNETLTNVVVTDPTLGTTLGTLASLAVGASVTYTASQTITQAELNAGGPVTNTAVVTDTQTPSQSSTVNTNVSGTPGVSIVKSVVSVGGVSGDPTATALGEAIDYSIVVTNTGNETLTNVVVTDPTLGTTLGTLASLAVGASVTYTTSQTITQAELNAGAPVTNTAVVTDTQTPSQSSTVSTNVSGTPGVSIVKSVTSVGGVSGDPSATKVGEAIDYSVVVTNTGNETLTNVVVTDPTLGTTLGTLASLAVGASVTYTASQTVTQAELSSGNPVTNTAVVTDTQTAAKSSTASTAVSLSPSVSIVKSVTSVGGVAGDPVATKAGEVIDYSVVVTNTGNETLTNVVVKDTTLGTTLGTLASLAAGASVTYTASQIVTQAEIDGCGATGSLTNTAVVTDSQTPTESSTASTPLTATPGVSIVKSVTSVGGVAGDPAATKAGEVIDYSVVVTNTGNETLTNVVVKDTTLGTTLGTLSSLAAGASVTYTASQTVTQTELSSSTAVTNTATVTDTQNVTGSSTASTSLGHPGVSIVKSVTSVGGVSGDAAVTKAGEVIDYNVVVTNTGNETLTNVVVTDTTLGTTLGTLASLAAGATVTYTAAQTVTQAEIDNNGQVTSQPGSSQNCSVGGQGLNSGCTAWLNSSFTPTSCTNGATYTFQNVTCTISGPYCGTSTINVPNACVTFSSSCTQATTVYNASQNCWVTTLPANCSPGNVFLSGLPCQIPSGYNVSGATLTWNIGSSASNCGASNVSWQTGCAAYNSFDQNGCNGLNDYNQIGVQVCDNLPGCGNGGNSGSCAGTPVNQCGNNNCCSGSSGNSGTCGNGGGTGTIACTGTITNTAVVTDSQNVTGTSTASTAVTQLPGVSIVKSVTSVGGVSGDPAITKVGEVIDYSIVVSNTGDETLTNVVVQDATLGTTLGTLASLAAGASVTYTASQTVTQAEFNCASPVTNTATVSDSQTSSASSTASTAVTAAPAVSIVKSATSVGGVSGDPTATRLGETIDYSIVVTNTGNETLTNVVVKDTTLGTTLGTLSSLAAGATVTYTASQTVTQTELNSGTAVTNTATVTDTQNATGTSTATTAVQKETGGISVIKLPSEVVVGTGGQVTYTFDVTNTGSTALTNVQLTDNIGTAANPDYITPVLQTSTNNGVLGVGQTWVYTATINQSGDYSSKGGSQSCSIGGQNLGSGSTAWLNSSFTPTSCKSGATYTFQGISCTISGPNCGTFTVDVPNACVTFSNSCTQATTVFNASENCWVTTLPANCNPGDVFLSGLPYQVPAGCNLSGATATWNIGGSANNCGSSNVSWQTGCAGYNSFDQNGCNGLNDYNQIGVQVCDNLNGCGDGGNCGQNSNNCAGTPNNQYTNGNCGSGYGYGGYGCGNGGNNNTGTCGNGGGSGTVSCGQLGDSSEADTATVTATTLGSGFSLGDAGNYGIIAFAASIVKAASGSPINGNVGVGGSCYSVSYKLSGDKITGNLVTTGTAPSSSSTGGTITGSITGNSSALSADISALQALSITLASETGTNEALSTSQTLSATSGTLDSAGDEVFTITRWANNLTINGTGSNNVVLNIASGVNINLDNLTLTGGLTANEVLINDQNTGTISATSGDTFNGTVLAPNAVFNVAGSVTINGHLYGGQSGQTLTFTSGATLNTPANTSNGTPSVYTVTASDSTEVQVLASNSPITENGTAPTGSLASLYGTADKLEFTYNPGDTVKLGTGGAGTASLSIPSSPAFMEISNNSNPFASGAQIYFEGEVQSGEHIYADATINQLTNTAVAAPNNVFSTAAGADIYIDIFASQAAFESGSSAVQTMAYSTSSSNQMHLGDEIGSLTLIGYVGANGGHLVS